MKKNNVILCLGLSSTLYVMSALAHDSKEHMVKSEQLDCSPMKKMDHSKMDMNDPVMQAIMKKCMGQMRHGDSYGATKQDETSEDHDHNDKAKLSKKNIKSSPREHGAH